MPNAVSPVTPWISSWPARRTLVWREPALAPTKNVVSLPPEVTITLRWYESSATSSCFWRAAPDAIGPRVRMPPILSSRSVTLAASTG